MFNFWDKERYRNKLIEDIEIVANNFSSKKDYTKAKWFGNLIKQLKQDNVQIDKVKYENCKKELKEINRRIKNNNAIDVQKEISIINKMIEGKYVPSKYDNADKKNLESKEFHTSELLSICEEMDALKRELNNIKENHEMNSRNEIRFNEIINRMKILAKNKNFHKLQLQRIAENEQLISSAKTSEYVAQDVELMNNMIESIDIEGIKGDIEELTDTSKEVSEHNEELDKVFNEQLTPEDNYSYEDFMAGKVDVDYIDSTFGIDKENV